MRQISATARGLFLPAGVAFLLALVSGCAAKGTVTGKVTYQDRPLTGGIVLFVSTAGKGTGRSEIGSDGSYTIEKMPAGPVKIAVDTRSAQGEGQAAPPGMKPPPGAELPEATKRSGIYGSGKSSGTAESIPENYADPEKSNLTFTVTGGSQTHNIDLK
jgi:hypothetical protein